MFRRAALNLSSVSRAAIRRQQQQSYSAMASATPVEDLIKEKVHYMATPNFSANVEPALTRSPPDHSGSLPHHARNIQRFPPPRPPPSHERQHFKRNSLQACHHVRSFPV